MVHGSMLNFVKGRTRHCSNRCFWFYYVITSSYVSCVSKATDLVGDGYLPHSGQSLNKIANLFLCIYIK